MAEIEIIGWDVIEGRIHSLPAALKDEVNTAVGEFAVEQLRTRTYPPRVEHDASKPYNWQSERQRRAYFVTGGFGHGIPYRRTNGLAESWTARAGADGGYIRNATSYADFVMGEKQQTGHRVDGWRKIQTFIDGMLSFRSSSFRSAVQAAVQAAIRKMNLG